MSHKHVLSLAILLVLLTCSSGLYAQNDLQKIKVPPLPNELYFCEERVPLEKPEVRDALLRELVINTYRHSGTLMVMLRSRQIRKEMEQALKEAGVPLDFFYLAAIESDLDPHAASYAGAVGYWQFREETAKEYGLLITDHIDQRKDLSVATTAAAKYFSRAYQRFHNWTLAAAAYNRGSYGLQQALDQQGVSSFFDLYLNTETHRYIYRILAMKVIMENPEKYFFESKLPKGSYSPKKTKTITIRKDINHLPDFARRYNTTYGALKYLNPWMMNTDYKLIVPEGTELRVLLPR